MWRLNLDHSMFESGPCVPQAVSLRMAWWGDQHPGQEQPQTGRGMARGVQVLLVFRQSSDEDGQLWRRLRETRSQGKAEVQVIQLVHQKRLARVFLQSRCAFLRTG